MAFVFGVATAPGSYGKIQGYTSTSSAEMGTYQDENGDVAGETPFNEKEEIDFEYVFDGTAPTEGASITIGGNIFTVDTVSQVESNTDYKRMSVTAHRYKTNTIPSS